jgi:hypothetical protein
MIMAKHAAACALSVAVALLGGSIQEVVAWGKDGHRIVANIAQSRLSPAAAKKMQKILGPGQNLSDVATWADDVRSTPEWSWSAPLHFIDVPDGDCEFEYTRDCKNNFCTLERKM